MRNNSVEMLEDILIIGLSSAMAYSIAYALLSIADKRRVQRYTRFDGINKDNRPLEKPNVD